MFLFDSVRIDVDQLLADRKAEVEQAEAEPETVQEQEEPEVELKPPRKRKSDASEGEPRKPKKAKLKSAKAVGKTPEPSSSKIATPKIVLRLAPPKPKEPETFPCCLCVSQDAEGLLRVHDPPMGRKEGESGLPGQRDVWMAHEECANVVPETWVDELETGGPAEDGSRLRERLVFGVGSIVRDRWNLVRFVFSESEISGGLTGWIEMYRLREE